MAASLYNLRDQLLALQADDRESLLALIEREEAKNPFSPSREDTEVWTAMTRIARSSPHRSLSQFVADRHAGVTRREWAEAVKTLYQFAGQSQAVRHRAQDHAALVELALQALAADLIGRKVALTPRHLVAALPRLRLAFEQCYPGYVEAGLLHKLIRRSTVPELAAE
jgi:hypothetical protein